MVDACYLWEANSRYWQDSFDKEADFLPRAIHKIATWHLGSRWTGKEPDAFAKTIEKKWSNQFLPEHRADAIAPEQVRLALRLLQRRRSAYEGHFPRQPPSPEWVDHYRQFTQHDWVEARERLNDLQQGEARFEEIMELIIRALRAGELVAVLKSQEEGSIELKPCPAKLWRTNIVDQRIRFYFCRLNMKCPGREDWRDTDSHDYFWIYITEESLARFIGSKRSGRPPGSTMKSDELIKEETVRLMSTGAFPKQTEAIRTATATIANSGVQIMSADTVVTRVSKQMYREKRKRFRTK